MTQRRPTSIGTPLLLALAAALLSGCKFGEKGKPTPEQVIAQAEATEAVERGDRLMEQGLSEAALSEFELAIETNPTLTIAYMKAGDLYMAQGDYATAEARFSKAAELEPSSFDAQYNHGLSLQMLSRVREAILAYLRALEIKPDDFNANLNLATAYLQLGEAAQALPYAERAVRLDGENGPARVNLGAVYAALDRNAEAVDEYRQAAELMELTPELLLNLADSLGKVGRHAEMVSTVEELLRIEESPTAYERLGSGLFRLRRYDEALAAFRQALDLDPDYYPALNGVGVCLLNRYIWSGKTDMQALQEAREALRRSLQIDRRQPRITELLSRYG